MNEPLFSPSWYRVAPLKPRIRTHAQIHRHVYRGAAWYVLQDRSGGQFHRLNPAAHDVIALMDGKRTVQRIWELVCERLGDDAPTQDETIRLLARLHGADVLQCEVPPDSLELFRRRRDRQRKKLKQRLWSPLALRFALIDPDRFLTRFAGLARPVFTPAGFAIWLGVVLGAAVLAGMHWHELTDGGLERILTPHNLLILWLTYPLVKALHELGHGFATKVWGGAVHEMGIMLLVLMPVPYVDASTASAFADKRRRMVVGAAGIMVELLLASLALPVWLAVEPGIVSAVAFNVMLIAGVSTLLFNGNPLLRFDGYYVLADAIEIPNLGQRANAYLGYLCQRYLFGLEDARSPVEAQGERLWFVGYGVAAFVYRLVIVFTIVVYVAGAFFFIGVLMALWAFATQLAVPAWKAVSFVVASPRLRRVRGRALGVSGALVTLLVVAIVLTPVPLRTRAEGVVWLPEEAHLRAGADGRVVALLSEPGTRVRAAQPIVASEDPFLSARVRVLESRLRELDARHTALWVRDRIQAEIVAEERRAVSGALSRARERAAALEMRSPGAGLLVIPMAEDLPGRFVRKGEPLGYVIDPTRVIARAVVPQDDIGLVRRRTMAVHVRLAESSERVLEASLTREVPAGTHRLPSIALGTSGGGAIPVDPADGEGLTTFEKVFAIDLSLPPEARNAAIGGRVHVRFDHGSEALAAQWFRRVRQLLLSRFAV